MANFIQSEAAPEIPGNAGQQSIIPTPDYANAAKSLTQSAMSSLDSYSKIYAQDKAQSLVNDEISNIEKARAEAEKLSTGAEITEVPESVRMSQDEWTMFSNAVKNGDMNPDQARLVAGSRLRSRIAQEPMFSRQLRQAASGVLGFNIESIGAQQYFTSFQRAEPTAEQKLRATAKQRSDILGIPEDKVYKQLVSAQHAEDIKLLTQQQKEAGIQSASEAFTVFNKENQKNMFPEFMGTLKEKVNEKGSLQEEDWLPSLEEMKLAELNELSTRVWGDTPQNTPEFERAQAQIEKRYEGLKELVRNVGYDKLLERSLNRQTNERALLIGDLFSDVLIMNETGGQAAVTAWFDAQSKSQTPTQFRQMMDQYPILSRYANLPAGGASSAEAMFPRVTKKLFTREDITPEEDPLVGPAAAEVHDNTEDEDTKTRVLERLWELGKNTTGMSILAKGRPDTTSVENVKGAVAKYKTELPKLITDLTNKLGQFSGQTNRFGEPIIQYEVDSKGDVQVSSLRPLSLPEGVLDDLKATATTINQYNKAHRNGWSTEFGEDHSQYIAKVQKNLKRASSVEFSSVQSDFKASVLSGSRKTAREKYERLRELNPEAFQNDFEDVYSAIRRARIDAGVGEE